MPEISSYRVFQSTLPVRGATYIVGAYRPAYRFQSTLPVRGATGACPSVLRNAEYFNPRSPCGERLVPHRSNLAALIFQSMLPVRGATHERLQREISETISIHAPRAGSDQGKRGVNHKIDKFQSMLPVRGATLAAGFGGLLMSISIHAPRAGSDRPPHQQPPSVLYFNPCSPCGERPS